MNVLQRLHLNGSATHLALVRILFCTHLLTVFTSPAISMLNRLEGKVHPLTASLLPANLESWIAHHITLLNCFGAWFCVMALVGLFARFSLALTFVAFLLTQNYYFRVTSFHDDWLYFNFYLLVLVMARSADVWSVDSLIRRLRKTPPPERLHQRYRWPIELMIVWYALVYFAAGAAKLFPLRKGTYFLTGQTIQQFVAEFHLDSPFHWIFGRALFDYLQLWPFMIIALLTVIVEIGAILVLWSQRLYWPVALAISGMHFGILCFGIPGFLQISLVSMVLFLPLTLFRRCDGGR